MIAPEFSPWSALAGGLMIGIAATLLLWLNGRIAGVSGIVGEALVWRRNDVAWRLLFVAGIVGGGALGFALLPASAPQAVADSPLMLAAAGLLVGIGTSVGSGCTSGHGVCGLARRSPRALVATLAFMASGIATVFVLRHVLHMGLPA